MNEARTIRQVARIAALVLIAVGSVPAQGLLPGAFPEPVDRPDHFAAPFMAPSSRIQQCFELPDHEGRPLTIRAVSLRFDGPTGSDPVSHIIDRLEVRVGVTGRSVGAMGNDFQANLTQPLQTGFLGRQLAFETDGARTPHPESFGGRGGSLRFVFASSVTVTIPPGGALVVELMVDGNTNRTDPAFLDYDGVTGERSADARSLSEGVGCSMVDLGPRATVDTRGTFDIGTDIEVGGEGYLPNSAVVLLFTTDIFDEPWILYGTPRCWLYLDPATGVYDILPTDPGGVINGGPKIPIPPDPRLCGTLLYVQNFGVAPRSVRNPSGVVSSNYRTIRVGCPRPRTWFVANPSSASARQGSVSHGGGLPMRIE